MKKILFVLMSALMITSCAMDDELKFSDFKAVANQPTEISFSNGRVGTRAIIEKTEFPDTCDFYVWGKGGSYNDENSYIADMVTYEGTAANGRVYNAWRTKTHKYFWEFNAGSSTSAPLDFLAVYTGKMAGTDAQIQSDIRNNFTYTADASGDADNVKFIVDLTSANKKVVDTQKDIMSSKVNNAVATKGNDGTINSISSVSNDANGDNDIHDSASGDANEDNNYYHGNDMKSVNFKFKHELAQIEVQARYITNYAKLTINSVRLQVANAKASLTTYGNPKSASSDASSWDFTNSASGDYYMIGNASADATIDLVAASGDYHDGTNAWTSTTKWGAVTYKEATASGDAENNNALVIPQALNVNDKLIVNYTYNLTDDDKNDVTEERVVELDRIRFGENAPEWKAGYVYIYKLTFSLYEILFSATVEEWINAASASGDTWPTDNASGYIIY